MNYRQLGKSALQISEIGFGCMSLKGNEEESKNIIHKAIELGVNFFDTADLYDKGDNEEKIGKALIGKRDKVILATKVGNQWKADGSDWEWNPRKEYILKSIDNSLRRLKTDYIDLYQLHGGTIEDPIDETIEAFELLKKQGKIRFYGISSIRPNVIRAYVKRSNIVSVMMQYSLLDRRPEDGCLSLLQQNNIGVLARGSVAQGLLVDKPAKEYLSFSIEEVKKAASTIQLISGNNRNSAQTAIRFVLHHPAVTSAVIGIRTMEQMIEAVQTIHTPSLSNPEFRLLQQSVKAIAYEQHK
ncbi:aldo/keto reductase [Chitinophagaceae bacterium LB-8]|uniref:Aldo/keto reductase n=1 Tax=Paraflavisolibacter caeni TaxID=2982496 RepID=A0A9X2XNU9_9BACT|nr:aldo/keto reductase [Paraflavisolibacter caeni]MCU7549164.1 aldo/keto reductase [Paraflavisolibacter caeni]